MSVFINLSIFKKKPFYSDLAYVNDDLVDIPRKTIVENNYLI